MKLVVVFLPKSIQLQRSMMETISLESNNNFPKTMKAQNAMVEGSNCLLSRRFFNLVGNMLENNKKSCGEEAKRN